MASKVQICNMALARLGGETITSLTDNTREAKLCNLFYDEVARRVMKAGSWTSTITRVALVQTANTPAFEYSYEYQLPVDPECLKVLAINETESGSVPHRIEKDKLLIDDSTVKIRYIAYLEDVADYDVYLQECVEVLLAYYLCLPLTGDKALAKLLKEEYMMCVAENLALNTQQGSKDYIQSNYLIEDR